MPPLLNLREQFLTGYFETRAENDMDMHDLEKLAKRHFNFDASLTTVELLRTVRASQGHAICFAATEIDTSSQLNSHWRADCVLATSDE